MSAVPLIPDLLPASAPDTPLGVILAAMRRKWADGDLDGAAALAKAAAPYIHSRLSAARAPGDLRFLSDDELDRECGA